MMVDSVTATNGVPRTDAAGPARRCPALIWSGNLVRPTGFEPVTPGFGILYSIQLSYGRAGVL